MRSTDPATLPRIQFDLLTEQSDLDTLIRGVEIARDIYQQQPQMAHIAGEIVPGADVRNRSQLEDYLRRTSVNGQHPVGTCRMGADPLNSVVDAELRVHGVGGLRVADASVMPDQIGGNPNVPVMMIAEKASDMIRGYSKASA